jgi:hypothetical protein
MLTHCLCTYCCRLSYGSMAFSQLEVQVPSQRSQDHATPAHTKQACRYAASTLHCTLTATPLMATMHPSGLPGHTHSVPPSVCAVRPAALQPTGVLRQACLQDSTSTAGFIRHRLAYHNAAQTTPPQCTPAHTFVNRAPAHMRACRHTLPQAYSHPLPTIWAQTQLHNRTAPCRLTHSCTTAHQNSNTACRVLHSPNSTKPSCRANKKHIPTPRHTLPVLQRPQHALP